MATRIWGKIGNHCRRQISTISKNGITYAEIDFPKCTIRQIPAFNDNYIYFVKDKKTNTLIVVDPGDANAVLDALNAWSSDDSNWNGKKNNGIDFILCTHHHNDHIGGNMKIKKATNCKIIGYSKASDRITGLDIGLENQSDVKLGDLNYKLYDICGHTIDHCGFYSTCCNHMFVGDTLFAMGCGRLFEGTPLDMYQSMQTLINVCDKNTSIFCGHEYTLSNAKFAMAMEGKSNVTLNQRFENVKQMRQNNEWTVPFPFGLELEANPFLRTHSQTIRHTLGLDDNCSDVDVFAAIRKAKDHF